MEFGYIFNAIGLLIGILGIVLAYVFYRKGRSYKLPCWDGSYIELIDSNVAAIPELDISYKSHLVANLFVAKIVFWNAGDQTIHGNDIAFAAPLRIKSPENGKILTATVITVNNNASEFDISLSEDGKCAFISFDYIDQNQGAVFKIVYVASDSKLLNIEGKIKGAASLKHRRVPSAPWLPFPTPEKFDERFSPNQRRVANVFYFGIKTILLLVVMAAVVYYWSNQNVISSWSFFIIGATCSYWVYESVVSAKRFATMYMLPSGFDVYRNNLLDIALDKTQSKRST